MTVMYTPFLYMSGTALELLYILQILTDQLPRLADEKRESVCVRERGGEGKVKRRGVYTERSIVLPVVHQQD